jgi:GTP pyrophosphokinase
MISIDNIIDRLKEQDLNEDEINNVKKAYLLAFDIHKYQFRQSGEPYIIHPLMVCNNLIDMNVYDVDSICAALLHDTIEDAKDDFSKDDIVKIFNEDVATLVDGVTKISRMEFSTKEEQNIANTRKIINGMAKDARIILIKLADRLHNMQTLDFKSPQKQKENAIETMELFVPMALALGSYKMKNELEDLSLKYIDPENYNRIYDERKRLSFTEEVYLEEMKSKLNLILQNNNISNDIIIRYKTICTLYKKIKQGYKLENIYDLFYLKILVNEIEDCYKTLGLVHKNYAPINGRFKDYIYNPKTNLYQSLHTTVSDPDSKLIKVKIRTYQMNEVAAHGIAAIWNQSDGETREESQIKLREKCQFVKKIVELDESAHDNYEFIKEIKNDLLTEHVYVYKTNGEIIELPKGSTGIDFVCQVEPEKLDKLTGIIVNGKEVSPTYILKNDDSIEVSTKGIINRNNWEDSVKTSLAKQKVKTLNGQN